MKFLLITLDVCRHQNWCKVSQQKSWSYVVRQSPQKFHTTENWCKVSQQKSWSYVVRQSPQKFHTRTGAKHCSKSHSRMSSDNHRKSFTPEPVQNIAAKVIVVCRQAITANVSHQNRCKVSQQKSWSYVVRQLPQKFHTRAGAKYRRKSHSRMSSDNHRKKFHTKTGAKYRSKSHGCMLSDNDRKSFTPELVQSIT